MTTVRPRTATFYHRLAALAGALPIVAAIAALAGWLSGRLVLATVLERIPMAPSTAVLFLFYGLAVLGCARGLSDRLMRGVALLLCAGGGALSLALLLLSTSRIYVRAERLGFSAPDAIAGVPAGHMSPLTALGFLLASAALAAAVSSARRPRVAGAGFAAAGLLTAGASVLLLVYLYGVPLLYGGAIIPPAATTSVAFIGLGLGLAALCGTRAWPAADAGAREGAQPVPGLLLLFLLVATGIVAAGYLYARAFEARYRGEVERSLSSVAELKVGELVQYRRERLGDALMFARNALFSEAVERLLAQPEDLHARALVTDWLATLQEHYQYDRVSLVDGAGEERIALPVDSVEVSAAVRQQTAETLRTQRLATVDFYRNEHDQRVYLTLVAPVFGRTFPGRVIAAVHLRVDPTTYLYPFLGRWPTPSGSAETYLVRREGNEAIVVSPLRFDPDSALDVRVPLDRRERAAVNAVLGQEGLAEGTDYRGTPVIAVMRAVPDSPWFLITKIDVAEVYAPLRQQMWMTILLVGALVGAAGLGIASVWRQRRAQLFRERYEAERDRAWLREVIARSRNEVWVFAPDTLRFTFVNRGACANIGYSDAELAAMTPLDLAPALDVEAFRAVLAQLRRGERAVAELETLHRRRDGSEYPVEIQLQYVAAGDRNVFLGLATDVTERRRMQEELRQAQKMEAVGRLAGGIAHDFNNQIFVINGYCDLLAADANGQPAIAGPVAEIKQAAARSAALTAQLLAFSRKQLLAPRVLDPNAELAGCESMLRRLIGEDVHLTIALGDDVGHVKVDPGQLQQVIVNLVINARDAMPDGGQLTLTTANVELDAPYAHARIEVRPGRYVRLAVTDTGHGIAPDVLGRIFEPFFTTKAAGRGTGLGLATTYGIVKQSGGHLEVRSTPGRGATFEVFLPRVDEPLAVAAPRPVTGRSGGNETILLAEDEDALRQLLERILGEQGYHVLGAPGGAEALAEASRWSGPIHLLLSDVVMPGMSGAVLAERLLRLHPETPVLFMSGYTEDAIVHHGGLGTDVAFLPKPCPTEVLLRRVREVLDGRARGRLRGRRLLVVDDCEADRVLQARLAARAGLEVLQAASGPEALALLAREPVDAVLTDLNMPGMDGLALTEAIRRCAPCQALPVVVLSGAVTPEQEEHSRACGASACVDKGTLDQERLRAVLTAVL